MYVQRERSERPAPSPYPPLQMTPEEQEYEQEMDALNDEAVRLLQELREMSRSHWRSQDRHQASYVEEIRRRQPSAFRK